MTNHHVIVTEMVMESYSNPELHSLPCDDVTMRNDDVIMTHPSFLPMSRIARRYGEATAREDFCEQGRTAAVLGEGETEKKRNNSKKLQKIQKKKNVQKDF